MTKFLGIIFLLGWVAGQLLRWPGEFPVTVLDVAVGIAAIGSLAGWKVVAVPRSGILLRKTASSHRKFADFANKIKVGLYITIIFATSWILGLRLFSWQESIPGGLYLLRFLGYLWVIANAGKLLAPVKKFIIPAFWIFVILAWVQYLFLPDTRFLLRYGWDEHYYRMIGTVLDPNYLGVMLGMIVVYAVEEEKKIKKQIDGEKIGKRSNGWLAVLALGGLVVTYSRASWVAVMVVGCWLLVVGKGFRGRLGKLGGLGGLGILGVIGLIGIWFVVPKPGGEGVNLFRTSSVEQRIESWKEGINVWREHPWLGVGFDNYREYKEGKDQERWGKEEKKKWEQKINHAENAPSSSWILLLATTGVVGIGWLVIVSSLAGICLFAVTLRRTQGKPVRSRSGWPRAAASSHRKFANFANYLNIKSSGVSNINRLWVGVLMMVGIHAVFNNTMFYPPVLGLLALIKAASED